MTLLLAAQLLLGAALLLAVGFHRYRMAQVCAVLWLLMLGAQADTVRVQEGALRFAPWLLLASAAMPEPRLLARRNLVWLVSVLALGGITLGAPAHVFEGLRSLAASPVPVGGARSGAAVICALAAFACLAWWAFSARVLEVGLAIVLLLAAAGCIARGTLPGWFAVAGAVAILTVVYSSYRMAFIDTLTGLPNRRALDETLARLSGNYALAMVDIDHFKGFNDTYGHAAGDVVLREVAQTLRRHAGGHAFRYGGEEFCVVYEGRASEKPALPLEQARKAVGRQRIEVAAPAPKRAPRGKAARPATKEVAVTISAGCAQRNAQRRTTEDVLKAADQALYKAKDKGRNKVVAA